MGEELGVHVKGRDGGAVPRDLLDQLHVGPCTDSECDSGSAKVMKDDLRKCWVELSASLDRGVEYPARKVR